MVFATSNNLQNTRSSLAKLFICMFLFVILNACVAEKDPSGLSVSANISGSSGPFSAPFEVRLAASFGDAQVFFTTDGTDPTERSTRYSNPISIKQTTVLKFFAAGRGKATRATSWFTSEQVTEDTRTGISTETYTFSSLTPTLTAASTGRTGDTLTCTLNYSQMDVNGKAVLPTFQFFNLTKNRNEPRQVHKLTESQLSATYTLRSVVLGTEDLQSVDVRGDEIVCRVILYNGFTTTISPYSAAHVVADTPPQTPSTLAPSQNNLNAGEQITPVQLHSFDSDGDVITFEQVSSTCPSIQINATTGLISGAMPQSTVPASDLSCRGVYRAVAASNTSTSQFTLNLYAPNHTPTVTCSNKTQGLNFNRQPNPPIVCTGIDSDLGGSLTYSLSGCGGHFSINNAGNVTGNMGSESCTAVVTVSDGTASSTDTLTFTLTSYVALPQGKTTYTSIASRAVNDVYVTSNQVFASTAFGLSITTNNGSTFRNVTTSLGLGSNTVKSVTSYGSSVYVATTGGLAVSTDGGSSYSNRTVFDGLGSNSVNAVFVEGNVVYAATSGGLSLSFDGGLSFYNTNDSLGLPSNDVRDVYASGDSIFAATTAGLAISEDGGFSWQTRTVFDGLGSDVIYGVTGSGANIYAATAGGVSISNDSGTTFINRTTAAGLPTNDARGIFLSGTQLLVSTSQGLAISNDSGTTFANRTTAAGLGSNNVRNAFANGTTVWAGTSNGLAYSTNSGTTFTNISTTNELAHVSNFGVAASGNYVYAATAAGLSYSTNSGTTFVTKTTADGLGNNLCVAVSATGSRVFVATANGVSISTNNGATWTNKTTSDGLPSNSIYSVTAEDSKLFVATRNGVAVSTDSGASYSVKTTANNLPSNYATSLFYSEGKLLVGTNAGLAISTDNGVSFAVRTTSHGLAHNFVRGAAFVGQNVYVGTSRGLSVSTDGGTSFLTKTVAHGLPHNIINNVTAANGQAYISTLNGIAITSDGSSFVAKTPDDGIAHPMVYSIFANANNIFAATAAGLSRK